MNPLGRQRPAAAKCGWTKAVEERDVYEKVAMATSQAPPKFRQPVSREQRNAFLQHQLLTSVVVAG